MAGIISFANKISVLLLCVVVHAGTAYADNSSIIGKTAQEEIRYSVESILFHEGDRKLYVFGHMKRFFPAEDREPIPEEPAILRFSDAGKLEMKSYAAFFGLEHFSVEEHRRDANASETWFVDKNHRRFLSFDGNPEKASANYARLLANSRNVESFFFPSKMPIYGFLVSITPAPEKLWITPRSGGGGPYAWMRDEKNGLLWHGDEGLLKIQSDGTDQVITVRVGDFVSEIFPNERDGSAWVYLSHKFGELRHIDKNGKMLQTVPIVKFKGAKTPIVMDFRREAVWFVDTGYPFRLVKKSLSDASERIFLREQLFGSARQVCWNPSLALDESEGAVWLYCAGTASYGPGLYKFDLSGKPMLAVAEGL
ncbi:MAG: hypothetical protein OEV31_01175 [Gammaproteobacteria bacterium]|nr:hypothetical protein [Gammaproteobacteria bacterium]